MTEAFKALHFKSRYRLALVAIAIMASLSFLTMNFMLKGQESYGYIINTSGKQRMLSQRSALLIEKIQNSTKIEERLSLKSELSKTIKLFEGNHQIIINPNDHFHLSLIMEKLYFDLNGVNDKFYAYLNFLKSSIKNDTFESYPIESLNQLLSSLDLAVQGFENESKKLVKISLYSELAIFFITILLLIVEALLIFKPLNELLKSTITDLLFEKEQAINARLIKSRFISNMTHEIRTPLNGIIGSIQLIKHEDDPKRNSEYIDIIESCSKTTLELVNSILDFEKIEAKKLDLNSEWFQISSIIKDINYQFIYISKQKRIHFNIENEILENSEFYIDGLRLKQVLINLISNAFKFTDTGSVSFILKYKNGKLEFQVSDTGRGIKEKDQELIYEPFTQLYQSPKDHIQGTGLGLNIARSIISLLGGELLLVSKLSEGSTFTFSVPAKCRIQASQIHEQNEVISNFNHTEAKNKLKILVLEDNSINKFIIKKYLDNLGHQYVLVENGEEGINQLKKAAFDFILCDIQMPVMNGLEFIKLAKDLSILKNAKIYAFTANTQKQDISDYKELGFDGTIQKPVTIFDLKKLLESLKKTS